MEGPLGQGQLRKLRGFVALLRASGVERRPTVAGNYLANPVVTRLDHGVAGPVPVAEVIGADGFFNGNHHYPVQDKLHQISQLVGDCAVGSCPN